MVNVRREAPEDCAHVRRVNEQAFGGAGEANLVDMLRASGKVTLSLVAEQAGKIVGHILFSPVCIESGSDSFPAVGLGPMAVQPELQSKGIGSMLVKAGLEELRTGGHLAVVVLGHADYYPRFGFAPASRFGITCEYDVPDEVFMALELSEGALLHRGGVAKYQREFNEV